MRVARHGDATQPHGVHALHLGDGGGDVQKGSTAMGNRRSSPSACHSATASLYMETIAAPVSRSSWLMTAYAAKPIVLGYTIWAQIPILSMTSRRALASYDAWWISSQSIPTVMSMECIGVFWPALLTKLAPPAMNSGVSSTHQRRTPLSSLRTCGTLSRYFAGVRDVHRSYGSE